jgi:outer membrane biosynthesis protein TonB
MVVIGASAVALLVVVGLLVLALSGGSESALLVIAEPREFAKISVDGLAFPNGQVVTPFSDGDHEVVVSASGYKTTKQRIRVSGRSTIQIRLVQEEPPAPTPEPPRPAPPPNEPPVAPPESPTPTPTPHETTPSVGSEPTPAEKPGAPIDRPPEVKSPHTTGTHSADTPGSSKKKKTGTLACRSDPSGAEIFIDGRSTGRRTPVPVGSAIELPVGKHKLTLKSGSKSFTETVEIREGEVTVRSGVLR